METKASYTEIRYFDFDFNLEKIKKITHNFNFCFRYYFPYITCVNIAYFEEHSNDILEKIKKLKLDTKDNLLVFYGKLWETYNGDDYVRFLKENNLETCFWADNPYRIKLSLQQKNLISL